MGRCKVLLLSLLIVYGDMWKKILYVFAWSVGLLFATFPNFFMKGQFGDLLDRSLLDRCQLFYYPFIMVMELFLFDTIYSYVLQKSKCGKIENVIASLILLSLFMLCLAFSLFLTNEPPCLKVCFVLGWIFLTIMKAVNTAKPEISSVPVDADANNIIDE